MTLLPVEAKKLHFEENDECQYSLSELLDIHKSLLNNVKKDIQKNVERETDKKYGDQVIITTISS